jgi:hypothetical protein
MPRAPGFDDLHRQTGLGVHGHRVGVIAHAPGAQQRTQAGGALGVDRRQAVGPGLERDMGHRVDQRQHPALGQGELVDRIGLSVGKRGGVEQEEGVGVGGNGFKIAPAS